MNAEGMDFVLRCQNLQGNFNNMSMYEPSNRVWACICIDKLVNIIQSEHNPEDALLHVIEDLNRSLGKE